MPDETRVAARDATTIGTRSLIAGSGTSVPPHNGTDTSRLAAESVREHVPLMREKVLAVIRAAGEVGVTTDEVEVQMGRSHQSVSPRIKELREAGLIDVVWDWSPEDADPPVKHRRQRRTRSGRMALVYIAVAR